MINLIKLKAFIPIFLVISAFGIYLHPLPIRVEHVAVYLSFFVLLFVSVRHGTIRYPLELRGITSVFLGFIVYAFLLGLFTGQLSLDTYVLGQIDRFLLASLVVIVVGLALARQSVTDIRRIWLTVVKIVVCGTAVVAGISIVQGLWESPSWLVYFQPIGDPDRGVGRETTALRALNMGRSTGIFATPFEAGLFLSTGLLLAVYLVKNALINWTGYIAILVIIIGGLFVLSKVFFLGLFLAFAYLLWSLRKNIAGRVLFMSSVAVFWSTATIWWVADRWFGFDRLMRYLSPSDGADLVNLYTAGRFSSTSQGIIASKWSFEDGVLGNGFGNYGVVDNAFLEVWYIAGFLGVAFLLAVLLIPMYSGWRMRTTDEGRLLFFNGILFGFASLGAPAITKNRISIVIFVVISILLLLLNRIKTHDSANQCLGLAERTHECKRSQ